ncbi:hypothetical protein VTN02DRAFT_6202 [Thermoascus thermophilus]
MMSNNLPRAVGRFAPQSAGSAEGERGHHDACRRGRLATFPKWNRIVSGFVQVIFTADRSSVGDRSITLRDQLTPRGSTDRPETRAINGVLVLSVEAIPRGGRNGEVSVKIACR